MISEVDKEFRFREDMEDIIEKFKFTISETVRYGKNNGFILKSDDKLEKIRDKSGYCLTHLYEYQKLGMTKEFDYPMDGQEEIVLYLYEIKELLQKIVKKCIKKKIMLPTIQYI